MVNSRCFVPGCSTGYDSDRKRCKTEGVKTKCMFTPPQDAIIFEVWKRTIPRKDKELTYKSCVCELHFADDDIERYYTTKMPDGSIDKIERGKSSLKPTAVPSIFPSFPEYLTKCKTKRKLPLYCPAVEVKKPRCSSESSLLDNVLGSKKTRLKRNAVPTLNLPKWPSESQNVNLASEKKKQRKRMYSKVLQSKETEINPVTYEEEEILPIADERLYGEFIKVKSEPVPTSDNFNEASQVSHLEIDVNVLPECLHGEFIEVKSEPVPTSGNISNNFNGAAQVPHLEKDVNVLPGIDEEISCDMFSDDEELKLIGNESATILRQKLEKLSARHKKLKMRFKESQVLCKLHTKEIVSLKGTIDSLRQIIKVSNDT